jgi:hypothetical protein
MVYNIAIRLWSVVIAVIGAIIFSLYFLRPFALEPLSLVDTNSSVQISYQQIQNSVLVNMAPTQYWWWFNGRNIYIYGLPTGRLCEVENEKYQPVFVIDPAENRMVGYQCIIKLDDLKNYYKNAPIQYIYTKPNKTNYNVYDAVNLLVSRNIISLPTTDNSFVANVPIEPKTLLTVS